MDILPIVAWFTVRLGVPAELAGTPTVKEVEA
jgi:hypothetical protein